MTWTRRGVLTGAAVGGGLVAAWFLIPRRYPDPLIADEDEVAFDAWLKIGRDGIVTVAVPQLEMGQGVTTLLPQIIATELGADWRQIAVEPAPVSAAYANIPLAAKWSALWMPFAAGLADEPDSLLAKRFAHRARFNVTADGTTLAAYEEACRFAAASARAVLMQAAADQWDVTWEECEAQDGFVTHGDKRLRFADLVDTAADFSPPDPPPLRPTAPSEETLPGEAEGQTAFPRIDLPSKVDGSYRFAGDVRLPDMVFAAIRHGPLDQSELTDFNPLNARRIQGIVGAVKGKRWLAVAATNWWAAERALERMDVRFSVGYDVDSDTINQRLADALRDGEAHEIAREGETDNAFSAPNVSRLYEIEPALHLPLETASATARFDGSKLELWVATQAPERTRFGAAKALGIATQDVVLYPMPAGGSFDCRLEDDHAIEVALIARELERPVQLVWSRWQDILRTRPRAPAQVLMSAKWTGDGSATLRALKTRIATPPHGREFGKRLFENRTSWAAIAESEGQADALACEGAMPPYAIPDRVVEHVPVEIGLSTGRQRGNARGYTCFAMESFIDEIAKQNAREPLSYRIAMLGTDPRLAACLQQVARLAEWDGGADQSGKGLACHRIGGAEDGGRIACIATARGGESGFVVSRLVAVCDIGRIVNLDIARQQIEGGLVFGMAMALGASANYRAGMPETRRLSEFNLPVMADCPEIIVDFIASEAPPADPGELSAVVAAPAIANALHSATGLRLRRLPLLSGGL
ncbi:molybdopterin cofactor-binding domain-containing protein [Altererythrobacter sp. GH1-8]|uniref:xanthine dehydrogenase family protein molybdopterin-binding subunit n=1 Tax=Altererythrobacter sp. GH1-8 TaxID=3349333 RepID=UPI00374CBC2A